MRIVIPVSEDYNEDFIEWLVDVIEMKIITSLDTKKLLPFAIYQNSTNLFKSISGKADELDFVKVVLAGAKLFSYKKVHKNWIIYMKESVLYPNYYATVYSLCKFVNYGLSDIRGYSLFTDVLNAVSAQVTKYYNMFLSQFIL